MHNYNLRSGISHSTRPTCRTKCTQEFVTHKYTWWLVQLYFLDRALPPHSDARMLANEMGEYLFTKSRLLGLRWMRMQVAQLRLPHQPQRVVNFLNFLHCLRRVYGELLPHVQSRAPLIPYHRLFCPSVWMNCSLLLGKLSTCLLSLASLQRTGRMLSFTPCLRKQDSNLLTKILDR